MNRLLVVAALSTLISGSAAAQQRAVFMGVVIDSAHQPIVDAEVSLRDMAVKRLTNGHGEFRFSDVGAGTHRLIVRRIGYGAIDTSLVFGEGETVARRIMLGRIVTLDTVVVKEQMRDLRMEEFEEHRARGFGHFFTAEEIEKQVGRSMAAMVEQTSGLNVVHGHANQGWLTGKRAPATRCTYIPPHMTLEECLREEGLYYMPDSFDMRQGMTTACYSQVYLDGMLLNAGRPTPPYDLNEMAPIELEAVEWYEAPSQAPPKYSQRAYCGVMILHSRRDRPKTKSGGTP